MGASFKPYMVITFPNKNPERDSNIDMAIVDQRTSSLPEPPLFRLTDVNFGDIDVEIHAYSVIAKLMNEAYQAGYGESRADAADRIVALLNGDGPVVDDNDYYNHSGKDEG